VLEVKILSIEFPIDYEMKFDLSALRHVASVGEALNPEVVVWGRQSLGQPWRRGLPRRHRRCRQGRRGEL